MRCAHPVWLSKSSTEGQAVSCGQCLPCRVNDRRKKTLRLMLEARTWPITTFLTVTYDPAHLPLALDVDGAPVGTLDPEHHRMFIRRLRDCLDQPRWFGVGEYGGRFGRPHYHYLVFGRQPGAVLDAAQASWRVDGVPMCDPRRIEASEAIQERLAYCAGYTVDKLKRKHREESVSYPEFMRQSLRPAIGLSNAALAELFCLSETKTGEFKEAATLDVPREVRLDGKVWPLDKRIREKWREARGLPRVDPARPKLHVRNPTAQELVHAQAVEAKMKHNQRGTL